MNLCRGFAARAAVRLSPESRGSIPCWQALLTGRSRRAPTWPRAV